MFTKFFTNSTAKLTFIVIVYITKVDMQTKL